MPMTVRSATEGRDPYNADCVRVVGCASWMLGYAQIILS